MNSAHLKTTHLKTAHLNSAHLHSAPDTGRGPLTLLVLGGLALWFGATVTGQHPNRAFDRVRDLDRAGLTIPNWRFFAPEPAQHDFHVLHRVLTEDGEQTPWAETSAVAPRLWRHAAWFPGRRREKALFDICSELIILMSRPGLDLSRFPSYRMLSDFTERAVRAEHAGRLPRGFQFLIARHTGHDQEQEPDYLFVSPFVPLDGAGPYTAGDAAAPAPGDAG
ncbi:DUF5819 family protein [Streptomyces sp. NPDC086091]|uniref:DUF5819 family protein n=2 Tax=unclassified Streptomyces TaxID=2593676 RepID=UPI00382DA6B4